ncbi:hypothetical protein MY10362_001998 [Beauveria mimosiformis]
MIALMWLQGFPIDNLLSSLIEKLRFPVAAIAILPFHATSVAEFSPTPAALASGGSFRRIQNIASSPAHAQTRGVLVSTHPRYNFHHGLASYSINGFVRESMFSADNAFNRLSSALSEDHVLLATVLTRGASNGAAAIIATNMQVIFIANWFGFDLEHRRRWNRSILIETEGQTSVIDSLHLLKI